MGLNTTHGCWDGAYSSFYRWRIELARAAGLPPLRLMAGFFHRGQVLADPFDILTMGLEKENSIVNLDEIYQSLPIKWECLNQDVLHELLWHSDCEGHLPWQVCLPLANRLEELLPNIKLEFHSQTKKFIEGLKDAATNRENVEFH